MTSLPIRIKAWATPAMVNRNGEHLFFSGMAMVIALTVFVGFSERYFFRSFYGAAPLPMLVHLHGIVNTCWIVVYLTQNLLVFTKRIRIHRKLGMVGLGIAFLVVLVGAVTAVVRAKQGASLPGVPPLVFLVVPLGDIFVFSILIGADLFYRRRLDVHKRLMLMATISILNAAVARLPFAYLQMEYPIAYGTTNQFQVSLLTIYGTTDLFLAACLIYDLISRKRIQTVTAVGTLLIVLSQFLRLAVSGTTAWLTFARWLTKLIT